jgi:hypothetical protein
MIEICRKSPHETRQGPVPSKYEHGRVRGEEGPSLAILGRDDQREGGCHRRRTATEDDQAEESEGWPMAKERGGQAAMPPKGHLRHPHGHVQKKAGPMSGGMKTGPSEIPYRTVRFPRVRPAPLRSEACPARDLGPHSGNIQKVGIIVTKIISRRLTFQSSHQCLDRGDLR